MNPIFAYHGSKGGDFDTFDPNRIGQTDDGYYGRGFYFSPTREEAEEYGPARRFRISIKNPFIIPSSPHSNHPSIHDLRDKISLLRGGPFHLKTNRNLPEGYYVHEEQEDNPFFNSRNKYDKPKIAVYTVYPKPELYGTAKEIYGKKSSSPLEAVIRFNDDQSGIFAPDAWWASGLLKQMVDRDHLHELLQNNGYDGIHVVDPDDNSIREYVAFHPSQISVANENQKMSRRRYAADSALFGHNFQGWIAPDGTRHATANGQTHSDWAQRYLHQNGIATQKHPVEQLHDMGWIRVGSPGYISLGDLTHPQVKRNLTDFLREFPGNHEVFIDAVSDGDFSPKTAGRALTMLSRYRPKTMQRVRKYAAADHSTVNDLLRKSIYNPHALKELTNHLEESGMEHHAEIIRTAKHGSGSHAIIEPEFVGKWQAGAPFINPVVSLVYSPDSSSYHKFYLKKNSWEEVAQTLHNLESEGADVRQTAKDNLKNYGIAYSRRQGLVKRYAAADPNTVRDLLEKIHGSGGFGQYEEQKKHKDELSNHFEEAGMPETARMVRIGRRQTPFGIFAGGGGYQWKDKHTILQIHRQIGVNGATGDRSPHWTVSYSFYPNYPHAPMYVSSQYTTTDLDHIRKLVEEHPGGKLVGATPERGMELLMNHVPRDQQEPLQESRKGSAKRYAAADPDTIAGILYEVAGLHGPDRKKRSKELIDQLSNHFEESGQQAFADIIRQHGKNTYQGEWYPYTWHNSSDPFGTWQVAAWTSSGDQATKTGEYTIVALSHKWLNHWHPGGNTFEWHTTFDNPEQAKEMVNRLKQDGAEMHASATYQFPELAEEKPEKKSRRTSPRKYAAADPNVMTDLLVKANQTASFNRNLRDGEPTQFGGGMGTSTEPHEQLANHLEESDDPRNRIVRGHLEQHGLTHYPQTGKFLGAVYLKDNGFLAFNHLPNGRVSIHWQTHIPYPNITPPSTVLGAGYSAEFDPHEALDLIHSAVHADLPKPNEKTRWYHNDNSPSSEHWTNEKKLRETINNLTQIAGVKQMSRSGRPLLYAAGKHGTPSFNPKPYPGVDASKRDMDPLWQYHRGQIGYGSDGPVTIGERPPGAMERRWVDDRPSAYQVIHPSQHHQAFKNATQPPPEGMSVLSPYVVKVSDEPGGWRLRFDHDAPLSGDLMLGKNPNVGGHERYNEYSINFPRSPVFNFHGSGPGRPMHHAVFPLQDLVTYATERDPYRIYAASILGGNRHAIPLLVGLLKQRDNPSGWWNGWVDLHRRMEKEQGDLSPEVVVIRLRKIAKATQSESKDPSSHASIAKMADEYARGWNPALADQPGTPRDWSGWLNFANHLEENGEPFYAALVRSELQNVMPELRPVPKGNRRFSRPRRYAAVDPKVVADLLDQHNTAKFGEATRQAAAALANYFEEHGNEHTADLLKNTYGVYNLYRDRSGGMMAPDGMSFHVMHEAGSQDGVHHDFIGMKIKHRGKVHLFGKYVEKPATEPVISGLIQEGVKPEDVSFIRRHYPHLFEEVRKRMQRRYNREQQAYNQMIGDAAAKRLGEDHPTTKAIRQVNHYGIARNLAGGKKDTAHEALIRYADVMSKHNPDNMLNNAAGYSKTVLRVLVAAVNSGLTPKEIEQQNKIRRQQHPPEFFRQGVLDFLKQSGEQGIGTREISKRLRMTSEQIQILMQQLVQSGHAVEHRYPSTRGISSRWFHPEVQTPIIPGQAVRDKAEQIKRLLESGLNQRQIAARLGMSPALVNWHLKKRMQRRYESDPHLQKAVQAIWAMKHFQPTWSHPSPGLQLHGDEPWLEGTHWSHHQDLADTAAVVAGTKPLALVQHSFFASPVGQHIYHALHQAGHQFAEIHPDHEGVLVGRPGNIRMAQSAMKLHPDLRSSALGFALGYPKEAVNEFLKREIAMRQGKPAPRHPVFTQPKPPKRYNRKPLTMRNVAPEFRVSPEERNATIPRAGLLAGTRSHHPYQELMGFDPERMDPGAETQFFRKHRRKYALTVLGMELAHLRDGNHQLGDTVRSIANDILKHGLKKPELFGALSNALEENGHPATSAVLEQPWTHAHRALWAENALRQVLRAYLADPGMADQITANDSDVYHSAWHALTGKGRSTEATINNRPMRGRYLVQDDYPMPPIPAGVYSDDPEQDPYEERNHTAYRIAENHDAGMYDAKSRDQYAKEIEAHYAPPQRSMQRQYAALPQQSYLGASQVMNSQNQDVKTLVAKDITTTLQLLPAIAKDAIHQTQTHSRPALTIQVDNKGDIPKANYGAAWFGLLTKQPGLVAFHIGSGDDLLHRFDTDKPLDQVHKLLSRIGIVDRTVIPLEKANQIVIYDRGAQNGAALGQLVQALGSKLVSARGSGAFLGSTPEGDYREDYRRAIRDYESKLPQPQEQSEQPAQKSRPWEKRLESALTNERSDGWSQRLCDAMKTTCWTERLSAATNGEA